MVKVVLDCVRIFRSFNFVCLVRLLFLINSCLICMLNVLVFGRVKSKMVLVFVRIIIIVIILKVMICLLIWCDLIVEIELFCIVLFFLKFG